MRITLRECITITIVDIEAARNLIWIKCTETENAISDLQQLALFWSETLVLLILILKHIIPYTRLTDIESLWSSFVTALVWRLERLVEWIGDVVFHSDLFLESFQFLEKTLVVSRLSRWLSDSRLNLRNDSSQFFGHFITAFLDEVVVLLVKQFDDQLFQDQRHQGIVFEWLVNHVMNGCLDSVILYPGIELIIPLIEALFVVGKPRLIKVWIRTEHGLDRDKDRLGGHDRSPPWAFPSPKDGHANMTWLEEMMTKLHFAISSRHKLDFGRNLRILDWIVNHKIEKAIVIWSAFRPDYDSMDCGCLVIVRTDEYPFDWIWVEISEVIPDALYASLKECRHSLQYMMAWGWET